MAKPNPMGATFAERAAAARGDKDFTPSKVKVAANSTFGSRADGTDAEESAPTENSTFADRAKAAKKSSKAVAADSDGAENKAVAKKTAAKK